MESVLEMVQVCCIIGTHTNVAQHSGFGVTFQLRVKQGRQHSAHQQQPSSSPDTQPLKRWLWPTISTPCLIEYKIDLFQSREEKREERGKAMLQRAREAFNNWALVLNTPAQWCGVRNASTWSDYHICFLNGHCISVVYVYRYTYLDHFMAYYVIACEKN